MKKTLSLFLAALMVFTSLFAMGLYSFAADNSISVVMDKSSYKVGEIATAKVVINANKISGAVMLLGGIVCAGLSIFMFFGCKAVTKGILILTKKIALRIKSCFIRKENAK